MKKFASMIAVLAVSISCAGSKDPEGLFIKEYDAKVLKPVYIAALTSSGTIIGGGYDGMMLYSQNKGGTWNRTTNGIKSTRAIDCTGETIITTGLDAHPAISRDGGKTYAALPRKGLESATTCRSITRQDSGAVFMSDGISLYWLKAGTEVWKKQAMPSDAKCVSLHAQGNVLWMMDAEGTLFRSDDNAVSWKSVYRLQNASDYDLAANETQQVHIRFSLPVKGFMLLNRIKPAMRLAVLTTENGGITWTEQDTGIASANTWLSRDGNTLVVRTNTRMISIYRRSSSSVNQ